METIVRRPTRGSFCLLALLVAIGCGRDSTESVPPPEPTCNDGLLANGGAKLGDSLPSDWIARTVSGRFYSHS